MRSLNGFRTLNLSVIIFCLHAQLVQAESAGTIAIVEGNAYAQKGEIYYTRPVAGSEIKVNKFGQYDDSKPEPAFVKWIQNTRRHLKPNDTLEEGEIIQTMGDAWLKILFKDDSLLDIGPAAMLQIQKFNGTGPKRNVLFKVLYGKVRGIVAQALFDPSHYQILTPSALMGVRGTEFIINVVPDQKRRTQTEVICLHGQVSVDVTKHTEKGLVYNQPIVVNPGSTFVSSGVHGLGQNTNLKSLSQADIKSEVARISPAVNTRATIVGANPAPNRLPGTGLKLAYNSGPKAPRKAQTTSSSFDTDHPPVERSIASASDNFEIAHDFKDDPGAFGHLRDYRKATGAPPISLLPATTSHVHVNLLGVQ